MIKKLWKLSLQSDGYNIFWRWSDSRGTMFSYRIVSRTWKTKKGAEKWGRKFFGNEPVK